MNPNHLLTTGSQYREMTASGRRLAVYTINRPDALKIAVQGWNNHDWPVILPLARAYMYRLLLESPAQLLGETVTIEQGSAVRYALSLSFRNGFIYLSTEVGEALALTPGEAAAHAEQVRQIVVFLHGEAARQLANAV